MLVVDCVRWPIPVTVHVLLLLLLWLSAGMELESSSV